MKFFLSVVVFVVVIVIIPGKIWAQDNFQTGELVVVSADAVVNSDYFGSGDRVRIEGTVNGDAYLAGGDIAINGTINGDVLAAGGNITINGSVTGDVRAMAGNISISGNVGQNVTAAAGNIDITPSAQVGGSVTLGAGNISLLGAIGKNVTAGAGQLNIATTVGGNVLAGVEKVTLSPEARVNGALTYWSENAARIEPGASVSGEIQQRMPDKRDQQVRDTGKEIVAGFWIGWKILSFLTALVAGWLLLGLMPVFVQRTAVMMLDKFLPSLGVGFLALAITPMIVMLLAITLIGIPLALLWLFMLGVGWWLAQIWAAVVIGDWAKRQFNLNWNRYVLFGLGLLLYSIATAIPVIGWIGGFVISLAGLGSLILTKRDYYAELRKKELI